MDGVRMDVVRTLPLSPQRVSQKVIFCLFLYYKIQF